MKATVPAALVAMCLLGCGAPPRHPAAGQPVPYQQGYSDGCESGTAAAGNPWKRFTKDVQRSTTDALVVRTSRSTVPKGKRETSSLLLGAKIDIRLPGGSAINVRNAFISTASVRGITIPNTIWFFEPDQSAELFTVAFGGGVECNLDAAIHIGVNAGNMGYLPIEEVLNCFAVKTSNVVDGIEREAQRLGLV